MDNNNEPTPQDASSVEEIIDAVFAELRYLGYADFDIDNVPEYAQLPLQNIVCFESAYLFGISPQKRAEFASLKAEAIRRLSAQVSVALGPKPVQGRYY